MSPFTASGSMKHAVPAGALGSICTGTRRNLPAMPVRSKSPNVSLPSPLRSKKRLPVSLSLTSAAMTSLETPRRVRLTLRSSASSAASMISMAHWSMVIADSWAGASILFASVSASR